MSAKQFNEIASDWALNIRSILHALSKKVPGYSPHDYRV